MANTGSVAAYAKMKRMKKALTGTPKVSELRIGLNPQAKSDNLEQAIDDLPKALEAIVRDWGRIIVRKYLRPEFEARANAAHYPVFTKHDKEGSTKQGKLGTEVAKESEVTRGTVNKAYDTGWAKLLGSLETINVSSSKGKGVRLGIGPIADVMKWTFQDFTRTNKISEFNNWFLATEFGTGIAANVGGVQNVNFKGDTKDPSGDGSWWLGSVGTGAHVYGQKGFGLFYDLTTRKPRSFWIHAFRTDFPPFLHKRLKRYSKAF